MLVGDFKVSALTLEFSVYQLGLDLKSPSNRTRKQNLSVAEAVLVLIFNGPPKAARVLTVMQ